MPPSFAERTKLPANALDRMSTACVTVGIATPIAGYVYNVSNVRALVDVWQMVLGVAFRFFGAVARHLTARWVLTDVDR
ncbi:hypothetical protein [Methylobacterium nigriterrae]|uniref:hypothetical protein n=1 Tax=Methylobacterium nigriterrae TaxID=3127512 RepID=UPI0030133C50